jgi:hypothetical protein
MQAFEDPADRRNGPEYHTGAECIELGCHAPAGTAWSPLWCHRHNVERMHRIAASLDAMVERLEPRS